MIHTIEHSLSRSILHVEADERQSDLLTWQTNELIDASRAAGVITGVPGRVEMPRLATGAAINELTVLFRGRGPWDGVVYKDRQTDNRYMRFDDNVHRTFADKLR